MSWDLLQIRLQRTLLIHLGNSNQRSSRCHRNFSNKPGTWPLILLYRDLYLTPSPYTMALNPIRRTPQWLYHALDVPSGGST